MAFQLHELWSLFLFASQNQHENYYEAEIKADVSDDDISKVNEVDAPFKVGPEFHYLNLSLTGGVATSEYPIYLDTSTLFKPRRPTSGF